MSLTAVDIIHTRFKTALCGYSKRQVDAFVNSVRESLEQATAEKANLQRRLEAALEELERFRKIEATMSSALTLAQRAADDVRANARRQAEMILQEAEQSRVRMMIDAQREVERLNVEIGKLEALRDRLAAELLSTLEAFRDLLQRRVIVSRTDTLDSGRQSAGDSETATEPASTCQDSSSPISVNKSAEGTNESPEVT
ncbi:MAG: DivIVA domain-containing protein [Armatimonadota bacterium]